MQLNYQKLVQKLLAKQKQLLIYLCMLSLCQQIGHSLHVKGFSFVLDDQIVHRALSSMQNKIGFTIVTATLIMCIYHLCICVHILGFNLCRSNRKRRLPTQNYQLSINQNIKPVAIIVRSVYIEKCNKCVILFLLKQIMKPMSENKTSAALQMQFANGLIQMSTMQSYQEKKSHLYRFHFQLTRSLRWYLLSIYHLAMIIVMRLDYETQYYLY